MPPKKAILVPGSNPVFKILLDVVSKIPGSKEPPSLDPKARAQAIAKTAALKAAGISGTLALPPGPFGLATVLPDLVAIWHIQRQMVADISSIYGKSDFLTKEMMIYCLFKHGGAALLRDLVSRMGERILIRRVAVKGLQQILQKVGVRISQRVIGQTISKWVPVIGALGVGAYAYYDTTQVAATCIETFEKPIEIEKA